jgi:hypothetical protein
MHALSADVARRYRGSQVRSHAPPRHDGVQTGPFLVLMLDMLAVVSCLLIRLTTMTNTDVDARNEQVLADTFRNLVRYALLKTNCDLVRLGVTPGSFSVDALTSSISARANAGIFSGQIPLLLEGSNRSRAASSSVRYFVRARRGPEGEPDLAWSAKHSATRPGGRLVDSRTLPAKVVRRHAALSKPHPPRRIPAPSGDSQPSPTEGEGTAQAGRPQERATTP